MQSLMDEDVVLESPATIARLLVSWRGPLPRPAGPTAGNPIYARQMPARPAPAAAPVARSARRWCDCGTCGPCLDNARWERIFNERFADPTYYGGISIRHNSSLAGT